MELKLDCFMSIEDSCCEFDTQACHPSLITHGVLYLSEQPIDQKRFLLVVV